MRLLLTTETLGDVWTFALELAAGLQTFNTEVHLAALGAPPTDAQLAQASRVPHMIVHPFQCRPEWKPDAIPDAERAGRWLLGLEQDLRPDVVHTNSYAVAAAGFTAPVVVTAHTCVLSRHLAVHGTLPGPEWDDYRDAVERGLRAADVVVAPTRAYAAVLKRLYAIDVPRIIQHARDPAHFPVPDKALPRRRVVHSSGLLADDAANVAALTRIAPGLDWPVEVEGESPHPPHVPDEGGRPEHPAYPIPNVTLLGRLSDRNHATKLAEASIFALPARHDPFGHTPLAAALSGCALVLGDSDAQREVWSDAALYVNPEDDAALSVAVRSLADNPKLLKEMAGRATARARRYRPAAMAKAYTKAYDAAARAASARPAPVATPA